MHQIKLTVNRHSRQLLYDMVRLSAEINTAISILNEGCRDQNILNFIRNQSLALSGVLTLMCNGNNAVRIEIDTPDFILNPQSL